MNDTRDLSAARIVVPDDVVTREISGQTIVLNLRTGRYHGLNPTGGAMLESLRRTGSVGAATEAIAATFGVPEDRVGADLRALCAKLLQRGLIEVDEA